MKKLITLPAILLFGAGTLLAQQNGSVRKADPNTLNDDSARASSVKKSEDNTAGSTDGLLKAGTMVEAELQSMLDVRRSEVGDEVVLKTTKSLKQNGEVVIPKGTKLIGRISEVQQKASGSAVSKLGVVIEKLEGKDLSMPVTASIVSITSVSNQLAAGDVFESSSSGSTSTSGRASGSGGGLLGGGLIGGATNAVGGTLNTATSTVGGITDSTVQTVGGATTAVGGSIRGLTIDQSASGSANGSTTLSSSDKNFKIEKGANFQIRLVGTSNN